jgi:hypothetical protein
MSVRNCVELKRLASLLHELGRGHLMHQRPFFIATSALCDAWTDGDGRRTWYDAAGVQLGRYDVAEGWRIIEGMHGECYCDLSPADCVVARHPVLDES